MANARTYLNHLLQSTGITPACSEEERAAAEVISRIFSDHGFTPELQEFASSASNRVVRAVLGIVLFIAVILMGISGALGVIGFLLTLCIAVIFVLDRAGRLTLPQIGAGGLSQNVIAYHKASGPLASPRNRPVVVVAHYDSPRADFLSKAPYAGYRSFLNRAMPVAMVLPAAVAVLRLFPLPDALKVVLWIVAIVAALVPLILAVATIANVRALPYTTGAVCNKSSVAAMLSVMDAVSPAKSEVEFPNDVPFEEYMEGLRQQAELPYTENDAEAGTGEAPRSFKPSSYLHPKKSSSEAEDFAAEPGYTHAGTGSYIDDMFGDFEGDEPAEHVVSAVEVSAPESVAPEVEMTTPFAEAADAAAEVEAEAVVEAEPALPVNAAGFLRYGESVIRELGMLPVECELEYETPVVEEPVVVAESEPQAFAETASPVESFDAGQPAVYAEPESVVDEVVSAEETAPVAEVSETAAVTEEAEAADVPAPAPAVVPIGTPVSAPVPASSVSVPVVEPVVAPVASQASAQPVQDFEEVEGDFDDDLVIPAVVDELVNAHEDAPAYVEEMPTAQEMPVEQDMFVEQGVEEASSDFDGFLVDTPVALGPDEVPAEAPVEAAAEVENPDATSVLEAMPAEMVLDEPVAAALPEQESVSEPEVVAAAAGSDLEPADEFAAAFAPGSEVADIDVPEQSTEFAAPVEPVLTGIEDFEEIIPTDDMEIVPAAFEELEVAEEPVDEAPVEAPVADATEEAVLDEVSTESTSESIAVAAEDESAEGSEAVEPVAELTPDATLSVEMSETHTVEPGESALFEAPFEQTIADEAVEFEDSVASTQVFEAPVDDAGIAGTQTMPVQDMDANSVSSASSTEQMPPVVPSFLEAAPARPQRQLNIPTIDASSAHPVAKQVPAVTPVVPASRASRSALFDLPDPSATPSDPLGETGSVRTSSASTSGFVVFNSDDVIPRDPQEPIETISTPAPAPAKKKRFGFFGRKKKTETESMSDWLGVDDDFDAKRSGRDIGSWDNFEGDDGWKGGAAGDVPEEELRQAVTSMGDDELLGHDIWFVATGSSENNNDGMRAFLDTHRDKLRGVFMINLECVGAGQLAMLATEGSDKTFKGDKRIMRLFSHVSSDFHRPLPTVDINYADTDARVAMERSLRAMTLAGTDGSGFALSHTAEDVPLNLNVENIQFAADVVTEVIRRS